MIDDILALLDHSAIVSEYQIWERDEAPSGAFVLKVRCRVAAHFTFQVWIARNPRGVRYAYQLLEGTTTILRWDNSPHFPNLKNYPHHRHQVTTKPVQSKLTGNPIKDLEQVLEEVEDYFET